MICVDYPCDNCVHKQPKKDGWRSVCTAFPEGIPKEILFGDPRKLTHCNNDIGYQPK